jgi:hypothetical protein
MMKKLITILCVLVAMMFIIGCAEKELSPEEQQLLEEELNQMSDEELNQVIESAENDDVQALSGQAYSIKIANLKPREVLSLAKMEQKKREGDPIISGSENCINDIDDDGDGYKNCADTDCVCVGRSCVDQCGEIKGKAFTCIDYDKGANLAVNSNVVIIDIKNNINRTYTDFCPTDAAVGEYYCNDNGKIGFRSYDCPLPLHCDMFSGCS